MKISNTTAKDEGGSLIEVYGTGFLVLLVFAIALTYPIGPIIRATQDASPEQLNSASLCVKQELSAIGGKINGDDFYKSEQKCAEFDAITAHKKALSAH